MTLLECAKEGGQEEERDDRGGSKVIDARESRNKVAWIHP